ncbi:MAG: signal peptidase I [Clostridiales bacterium]|nr:signal peptidase I [Candidatus Crickella equi]
MKVVELLRSIMAGLVALIIIAALLCLILHYEPAVVMSGSMEPTFHTGSVVLVDRDNTSNVKIGDAIAFDNGGTYITHRIVDKSKEGYITKGDANESEDPWIVPAADVKGKVVFSIPMIGYLMKLFAGTPGIILFATIIICMGLSSLLDIVDDNTESNKTSAA